MDFSPCVYRDVFAFSSSNHKIYLMNMDKSFKILRTLDGHAAEVTQVYRLCALFCAPLTIIIIILKMIMSAGTHVSGNSVSTAHAWTLDCHSSEIFLNEANNLDIFRLTK